MESLVDIGAEYYNPEIYAQIELLLETVITRIVTLTKPNLVHDALRIAI
jgi:hypothetical protein